jgi:hypothetical protein
MALVATVAISFVLAAGFACRLLSDISLPAF